MSKMKRRGRGSSARPAHRPNHGESRAADAVTIAWSLTVMMTLVCQLGAMGTNWYVQYDGGAERIEVLSGLLLFSALVLGAISLLLMPVVWRSRRVPPPRAIAIFAVVVAAAPLLTLMLRN